MKSSQTVTVKYVIRARFEVEGVVEKPDVIGAVFGQTEGLFGPELDLRELQKSGRIGRIEIRLESKQDKTTGTITIPTSLDRVSTAIIAASIESINRVGPCEAKVTLDKMEDIRNARRRTIINRAKEVLHEWTVETMPGTDEVFREVSETLRLARVEKYGPEELTAGPDIESAKKIIIVEGRADVITMLRAGIQNVIALEGAKIPQTIIKLCREKEATAFLDGDRGGDLILKELLQVTNVKYIARAPPGKEVEELDPDEIVAALDARVPISDIEAISKLGEVTETLRGTLEAILLGEEAELGRVPVSELVDVLKKREDVMTVVFDGIVTGRLIDTALDRGVGTLVGERLGDGVRIPDGLIVKVFNDF